MSGSSSPALFPSPSSAPLGAAVDAASATAVCVAVQGLQFPLSPEGLRLAVHCVLSLPSPTRQSALLHRIAAADRRARNERKEQEGGGGEEEAGEVGGAAKSLPRPPPSALLLLPPSSPSSPFFSHVYSAALDAFFSAALHSSLANPLLCGWCLDVLCAGQETHSFLTAVKADMQRWHEGDSARTGKEAGSVGGRAGGGGARTSSGCAPSSSHPSFLCRSTPSPPPSTACARPFAEGELAYTCTQCQTDPQWSAQQRTQWTSIG